jgi:hypothetical protein
LDKKSVRMISGFKAFCSKRIEITRQLRYRRT